jgi:hypothetical protein
MPIGRSAGLAAGCRETRILTLRERSGTVVVGRNTIGMATGVARARRWRGIAALALVTGGLAGCSSVTDHTAAIFSTSPGKFEIYTCQDIEPLYKGLRTRQIELEQLMARASQGGAGSFVSTIAYRTEYEQTLSDMKELGRTKEDKQCAVDSKFSSGRAVF